MKFMYNVGITLVRMDLEFQVLCMKLERLLKTAYRKKNILCKMQRMTFYSSLNKFVDIYDDIENYLSIHAINVAHIDEDITTKITYKKDLLENVDKINKLNNIMYNDYTEVSNKKYY